MLVIPGGMERKRRSDDKREQDCPCVKPDCERHGDCVACHTNHMSKPAPPFCKRQGTKNPEGLIERVSRRLIEAGMPVEPSPTWGAAP